MPRFAVRSFVVLLGLAAVAAPASGCSLPVDEFSVSDGDVDSAGAIIDSGTSSIDSTDGTDGVALDSTTTPVDSTPEVAPTPDTAPKPDTTAPTDTTPPPPKCPSGATACGTTCKVLADDGTACGSCSKQCDDDQSCIGSTCVCRLGTMTIGDKCVAYGDATACGTDKKSCKMDELCNVTDCRKKTDGCPDGRDQCPSGAGPAASTSCFDLSSDPLHCGACAKACTIGETCVTGGCHAIYPGAGCTTCPCSDCGSARCCGPYTGHSTPTCIVGVSTCP